jgi:hypothetical protein
VTKAPAWQSVAADDIPILATIRWTHHDQTIVGVVVDVMRQHELTVFIVRDDEAHHHVVPTTTRFEIHNDRR